MCFSLECCAYPSIEEKPSCKIGRYAPLCTSVPVQICSFLRSFYAPFCRAVAAKSARNCWEMREILKMTQNDRWAERRESPRRLLCTACLLRETRAASRLGPDRILPANSHSTTWPDGTVEIRQEINAPLPYHSPHLSTSIGRQCCGTCGSADPDPYFTLMLIQIPLFSLMRIRMRLSLWGGSGSGSCYSTKWYKSATIGLRALHVSILSYYASVGETYGLLVLHFEPPHRLIDFDADPEPKPVFDFDADPDPAFHCAADPDPVFHNYGDPCGSGGGYETLPVILFHQSSVSMLTFLQEPLRDSFRRNVSKFIEAWFITEKSVKISLLIWY